MLTLNQTQHQHFFFYSIQHLYGFMLSDNNIAHKTHYGQHKPPLLPNIVCIAYFSILYNRQKTVCEMCGCFFFFLVGFVLSSCGRRDGDHLVQIRMWRYKFSLYTLTGGRRVGARRSERVTKFVPHQMMYSTYSDSMRFQTNLMFIISASEPVFNVVFPQPF